MASTKQTNNGNLNHNSYNSNYGSNYSSNYNSINSHLKQKSENSHHGHTAEHISHDKGHQDIPFFKTDIVLGYPYGLSSFYY